MTRLSSPPVLLAALVLAMLGAAALGWLWLRDGKVTQTAVIVMLVPLGLLLAVALASGTERFQSGLAAWATTLFVAILPAWYVVQGGPGGWLVQWRFVLGYAVLDLVLLLLFLLWVAAWTARVPPAPGSTPLPEYRLQQRIESLAGAGLDLKVERAADRPHRIHVQRDFRDGKRTVAVRLTLVPERHCVLAREMSVIRGDRPVGAGRHDVSIFIPDRDGTHPDADLIWEHSITVTPASESLRRQLALRVLYDRVEDASGNALARVPGNLPHVLTELVHQSGWSWQGLFFDWQGRCR